MLDLAYSSQSADRNCRLEVDFKVDLVSNAQDECESRFADGELIEGDLGLRRAFDYTVYEICSRIPVDLSSLTLIVRSPTI